jgi:hypothetical protein
MENRIESLNNRTLRIDLNHNTVGWNVVYSNQRIDFVGNLLDDWSRPTVDFIQLAATVAHITLEPLQEILNRLYQEAALIFDTTSTFDACLYATSSGLIDLCVASYGITSRRATVGKFFVLGNMSRRATVGKFIVLGTMPV